MKNRSLLGVFIMAIFIFGFGRKGLKYSGTYIWKYTTEKGKLMLIKTTDSIKIKNSNHIQFSPNHRFEDRRSPMCGNDIVYNKIGCYYLSFKRKKLILNYLDGELMDNAGGRSKQVYVKGRVHYTITYNNVDTIFLKWKYGNSQKTIPRN